jgi:diguanylate cyclase (GGDEF)-like protein
MSIRNVQGSEIQGAGNSRSAPVCQAVKRGTFAIEHRAECAGSDLESALTSALLAGDTELGQIVQEVDQISRMLRSKAPDSQSLRVATHPAVWSAVKHALLDRELRYLALTDELTCLYNRRGFFAAAAHQLKLARRNMQGMLLFFCDLDNLKKINDTYGHAEGDLALVRAADALEEAFRESDVVARLGGDEFAVLALTSPDDNEEGLLRRLEKSVEKAGRNDRRYQLSLSVGVARFDPKRAVSLGELMAEADKAMYEQKRGRLQPALSKV